MQKRVFLGNLDAKRDWGHAKDYVKMMWMILQYEKAEDWVISTGTTTSIRDFIKLAFNHIGIDVAFEGKGLEEIGVIKSVNDNKFNVSVGQVVVCIDPEYFRPTEVDILIGDSTKAKEKLGWEPEISLESLVADMMDSDLELMKKVKQQKN